MSKSRSLLCVFPLLLMGCRAPAAPSPPPSTAIVSWLSSTHSNRLVPVYLFGGQSSKPGTSLADYIGENSVYRDPDRLKEIYGRIPPETLNPDAQYMDQTEIFDLQRAASKAGKRYIFLVIFDGMDWHTPRAVAASRAPENLYREGPGSGTFLQDYTANGTAEFGTMVTSPFADSVAVDVGAQSLNSQAPPAGGYSPKLGGASPWDTKSDTASYLLGLSEAVPHVVADSASSATAMMTGRKTYNGLINVGPDGAELTPLARSLQVQGWAVGVVTSVPISHATPAASYAKNVSRKDYQDLTRDLLGLPSVARPEARAGLDVLLGAGAEPDIQWDPFQGTNFVPGNRYLTQSDTKVLEKSHQIVRRSDGVSGARSLAEEADIAAANGRPLLGFFGEPFPLGSHLPWRALADSSQASRRESPTLAQETSAALTVLASRKAPFWLLVEAGDVDWGCHVNRLDYVVDSFESGEDALRTITQWVERESNWDESLVIVTGDHGHSLTTP